MHLISNLWRSSKKSQYFRDKRDLIRLLTKKCKKTSFKAKLSRKEKNYRQETWLPPNNKMKFKKKLKKIFIAKYSSPKHLTSIFTIKIRDLLNERKINLLRKLLRTNRTIWWKICFFIPKTSKKIKSITKKTIRIPLFFKKRQKKDNCLLTRCQLSNPGRLKILKQKNLKGTKYAIWWLKPISFS